MREENQTKHYRKNGFMRVVAVTVREYPNGKIEIEKEVFDFDTFKQC